jgi:4'-phosphopantetheinyl transferase
MIDCIFEQAQPSIFSVSSSFPEKPQLSAHDIHVCWTDLQSLDVSELGLLLSSDELNRANRFRFTKDRHRFIGARGTLRLVLSRYLSIPPDQITFNYNQFGKPTLNDGSHDLSFSLTHTNQIAFYAVTYDRAIGIDVEFIRDDVLSTDDANIFLSKNEQDRIRQLSPGNQRKALFQIWTRKEAFAKALGQGLLTPLQNMDLIGSTPLQTSSHSFSHDSQTWSVQDLRFIDSYAGAVVATGSSWKLSLWRWLNA